MDSLLYSLKFKDFAKVLVYDYTPRAQEAEAEVLLQVQW